MNFAPKPRRKKKKIQQNNFLIKNTLPKNRCLVVQGKNHSNLKLYIYRIRSDCFCAAVTYTLGLGHWINLLRLNSVVASSARTRTNKITKRASSIHILNNIEIYTELNQVLWAFCSLGGVWWSLYVELNLCKTINVENFINCMC